MVWAIVSESELIFLFSVHLRLYSLKNLMPMFACTLLRIKVIFCYAQFIQDYFF
jgi:hypothetical protein